MSTTYDRTKYELIRRNQAALDAVNRLASEEAMTVMTAGLNLEKQVYGGFSREVLPALLDKWGNVNANAAIEHYNALRLEWSTKNPRQRDKRQGRVYAEKVLQGQLYAAKLPQFNLEQLAEPIIGTAMQAYVLGGAEAANTAGRNALLRQIGAYNRDTMLFNAGLDDAVMGVQRVASINACAFCKTLALGYGRRGTQVSDYAVNWHAHCRCSIEVLYEGDKPVRPDYYDEYESQLKKAYAGDYSEDGMRSIQGGKGSSIRDLVQRMRAVERTEATAKGLTNIAAELKPLPPVPTAPVRNLANADFPSLMRKSADEQERILKEVFDGQQFGDFKLQFNRISPNDDYAEEGVEMFAWILDGDGNQVGQVRRVFFDRGPSLGVHHELMKLDEAYRGQGFSTAFSQWAEDLYRANGMSYIEVDAGLADGAYTWAKAGYTWRWQPSDLAEHLQYQASQIRTSGAWQRNVGITQEQADELAARVENAAQRMLDEDWESPDYIQPIELAQMEGPIVPGSSLGGGDKTFARWLLSGARWAGKKELQ